MKTHETFPVHDGERPQAVRRLGVRDVKSEAAETLPHMTDRLDRPQGHFMGAATYAPLLAQWGVRVRRVPSPFWSLDGTAAVVACPCGASPVVEALAPLHECTCGRFFFFDGSNTWAYNTPLPVESVEEE